jgi:hypothetical protein
LGRPRDTLVSGGPSVSGSSFDVTRVVDILVDLPGRGVVAVAGGSGRGIVDSRTVVVRNRCGAVV